MKNHLKLSVLVTFILYLSCLSIELKADPPNPPIVPSQHGTGGNITGAPLDGMFGVLLLICGGLYGGWMLFEKKKAEKAVNNDQLES